MPEAPIRFLMLWANRQGNRIRRMNFTSGWLTLFDTSFPIRYFVQRGMNQSIMLRITTNTTIHTLKSSNSTPRANTVPKSEIKKAARIIFPSEVSLNFSQSSRRKLQPPRLLKVLFQLSAPGITPNRIYTEHPDSRYNPNIIHNST